jgi:hypothetical protein
MKIETDIPVPMSTRSRKYPFLDMQVGESIWYLEVRVSVGTLSK